MKTSQSLGRITPHHRDDLLYKKCPTLGQEKLLNGGGGMEYWWNILRVWTSKFACYRKVHEPTLLLFDCLESCAKKNKKQKKTARGFGWRGTACLWTFPKKALPVYLLIRQFWLDIFVTQSTLLFFFCQYWLCWSLTNRTPNVNASKKVLLMKYKTNKCNLFLRNIVSLWWRWIEASKKKIRLVNHINS